MKRSYLPEELQTPRTTCSWQHLWTSLTVINEPADFSLPTLEILSVISLKKQPFLFVSTELNSEFKFQLFLETHSHNETQRQLGLCAPAVKNQSGDYTSCAICFQNKTLFDTNTFHYNERYK